MTITPSPTLDDSEFDSLLLAGTPIIDVRAPQEFLEAHVPGSTNLPILQDEERKLVGTCYKQRGQDAAIQLGHELVGGDTRSMRVAAWKTFVEQHPTAVIACFRGGLRSKIAQSWLTEIGIPIRRVAGGYKALRTHLLKTTTRVAEVKSIVILSGKTGTGKTHLINQLSNSVDLEGLANHRGSAFGRRVSAQPTQVVFENKLAIELLKQAKTGNPFLFLEDESRAIGSIALPLEFHRQMSNAKIASVHENLDFRIETILNDYIVSNYEDYMKLSGEQALALFSESLIASLDRIKKRLGGERHSDLRKIMQSALNKDNDLDLHREWIKRLLVDYYDPMYEYQMSKKSERVTFRGSREEFLDWAAMFDQPPPLAQRL